MPDLSGLFAGFLCVVLMLDSDSIVGPDILEFFT